MKLNKVLGAGLAVAVVAGLTLPSFADQVSEVVISLDEPTQSAFDPSTPDVPRMHVEDAMANESVRVRFINNSSKHATFTAPGLQIQGNSFLVPANSTREYVMPRSAVGYETRKVTYNVDRIPDPIPPGPQFEDWKNRLAALIAAQRPDYSYFPQYQFNN